MGNLCRFVAFSHTRYTVQSLLKVEYSFREKLFLAICINYIFFLNEYCLKLINDIKFKSECAP